MEARPKLEALVFDCCGVVTDMERDGHRVAFNRAFKKLKIGIYWSEKEYGELLNTSGGKERLEAYLEAQDWPPSDRRYLVTELHRIKTEYVVKLVESGFLDVRPGVVRLMDEAFAEGVKVAICSAANGRLVEAIVMNMLGPDYRRRLSGVFAGDVVEAKKPDPEVYRLASKRLGIAETACMVVEDTRNGLLAAKKAGMKCVIATTEYTRDQDFSEADAVFSEVEEIRLSTLARLMP